MYPRTLCSAIALACAAPAAMADSGVTIYGVADVGVLSISDTSVSPAGYVPNSTKGGSIVKMQDGGIGQSYLGFRGTEDLGGGLSAFVQLQGNVNFTNGNVGGPNSSGSVSFFNQFSELGLSGAYGRLTLGRQVSPMYYAMASTDAREARYFGSVLTGLVGLNSASGAFIGNNSNPAFGTVYNDNAIVYATPAWNGLTANVEYALGNSAGGGNANLQDALTLQYKGEHLKLSALYYNGYGNNVPAATTLYTAALGSAGATAALAHAGLTPTANTNRLTSVGAMYSWNTVVVSGSYFEARNPANALVRGGSGSLDMWTLAANWHPVPLVMLSAGYYKITDKTFSGNSASQFAVGADYVFSKQTLFYVEAASVTNSGANMNLSPVYGNAVTANTGAHAVMAGMRHNF